jgi:tetratricopeptide (TPR) repeat protein/4-amino-4-deoxy-L-arabinose transferase-like glycosyltransferase
LPVSHARSLLSDPIGAARGRAIPRRHPAAPSGGPIARRRVPVRPGNRPATPARRASGRPLTVWIGTFALALAIRLAYLWQIRASPAFALLVGDGVAYDAWARELAAGNWLGTGVFYQAPLYPYFLGVVYAAAGQSLVAVRLVQAVLGAAACVALGIAGSRLFDRTIGVAAALALAVYPTAFFSDALIQKSVLDVLFVGMLLLALAEALRRRRPASWVFPGLALGALVLTRENALALAPVLLGFITLRMSDPSARLRGVLWCVAGLVAVLAPVALRNLAVGGELHLTTAQLGPNLYIGNHAGATGMYQPLRYGRGDASVERLDATSLAEEAAGRALTPAEVSAHWRDKAFDFMRSEPRAWLALLGRKALLFVNRVELGDAEDPYTYGDWSWLLRVALVLHFGVLVPLAAAGIVLTWRRGGAVRLLAVLLLVYAASVIATFVMARYRHPVLPLLLLFAAAAVVEVRRLVAGHQWSRLAPALLTAVCVAIVANWPLVSESSVRAASAYNLARRLEDEPGRLVEAIAYYRRALELEPRSPLAHNNLGLALARTGKAEEGRDHLARAVELQPRDPDFRHNLANTLAALGDGDAAIAAYEGVLTIAPGDAAAHSDLGVVLQRRGEFDAAARHYQAALAADPRNVNAMTNLGALYAEQGQLDGAIALFGDAVAAAPDAVSPHVNLATALAARGRLDDSIAEWTRTVALAPDDASAHRGAASALAALGRVDDAITHLRTAVRLAPESIEALTALAHLLATRPGATAADAAEAVRYAERALAIAGDGRADVRTAVAEARAASRRTD